LFIEKIFASTFSVILTASIFLFGSLLNWKVHLEDKRERTTLLSYELKDSALKRFTNIKKACEILSKSSSIWRLKSFANDRNELLDVLREQPPYISTDVIVWSLDSNYISLYFLPDYIFVWHNKNYGVVSYDSIYVSFSTKTTILTGSLPKDATIVDYIYQHTRKDGLPDRRYKYNPTFPLVKYGLLEIKSRNGWSIVLQVSNVSAASYFADVFNREVLNKQDNQEPENSCQQKSNKNQTNTSNNYQTNTNSYQRKTNYNQHQTRPKTPTVVEGVRLVSVSLKEW
jgi:hypothetical protein